MFQHVLCTAWVKGGIIQGSAAELAHLQCGIWLVSSLTAAARCGPWDAGSAACSVGGELRVWLGIGVWAADVAGAVLPDSLRCSQAPLACQCTQSAKFTRRAAATPSLQVSWDILAALQKPAGWLTVWLTREGGDLVVTNAYAVLKALA